MVSLVNRDNTLHIYVQHNPNEKVLHLGLNLVYTSRDSSLEFEKNDLVFEKNDLVFDGSNDSSINMNLLLDANLRGCESAYISSSNLKSPYH